MFKPPAMAMPAIPKPPPPPAQIQGQKPQAKAQAPTFLGVGATPTEGQLGVPSLMGVSTAGSQKTFLGQ